MSPRCKSSAEAVPRLRMRAGEGTADDNDPRGLHRRRSSDLRCPVLGPWVGSHGSRTIGSVGRARRLVQRGTTDERPVARTGPFPTLPHGAIGTASELTLSPPPGPQRPIRARLSDASVPLVRSAAEPAAPMRRFPVVLSPSPVLEHGVSLGASADPDAEEPSITGMIRAPHERGCPPVSDSPPTFESPRSRELRSWSFARSRVVTVR
ncbi:MAG: hypothetical protein RL136_2376 [Planctomycetota bacterium]|jgi:hypothetical protein